MTGAATPAGTFAPALPAGLLLQPYREKVPGATDVEKAAWYGAKLDALSGVNGYLIGLVPHGFTTEFTQAAWTPWRDMAHSRQLVCGAAYGLDDSDPAGKGQRIGAVAATPGCVVILLDAEGAWDHDAGTSKVDQLCSAIRAQAPRVPLADQAWPVPTEHPSYPNGEFARWCLSIAEQRYYNDWRSIYGRDRYVRCEAWFDQSWGTEDRALATDHRTRPHTPTIQGYGWDDTVPDLVTCLCKYDGAQVYVWCEPWPEESFWLGARCVAALHARGYRGPNAVWLFQTDNPPLQVDGICGPATRAALGVS